VGKPLIRLRNARKTYCGSGGGSLAVSDITLDIAEGELVSLVGSSGCGKTTLLKILADLQKADDGDV
jgi:NitT/TauT family transport system ATP-binding protein